MKKNPRNWRNWNKWLPFVILFLIGVGVSQIWEKVTTPSQKKSPPPVHTVSPFIPLPPNYTLTPLSQELVNYLLIKTQKIQPVSKKSQPPTPKPKKLWKLPKLVIIMDDMAFPREVRELKKLHRLGLKITPSFLPPTPRHPLSAQLAEGFSHYMIHLPLEADEFSSQEEETLKISDPYPKIQNRIWRLHLLYPRAKFVNNHTGSTFTANLEAMKKLFRALKFYNLGFIDSRTTSQTQGAIANTIYKIPYFSRNVFLDNSPDSKRMRGQLRRAISIARSEGYAIVICHPFPTTFQFLRKNRHWIQSKVELIYPSDLLKLKK
ncbi:MAG: divergent polysaccharide deacetylase family protein [Epsilonproteobacteria bacterium]|jgi:polysaccharide deacetylase 2 family uncharacterized protein YibQ|nr:divergent polysaccharide deacetylase family protein [Campylobacterota bacterium]NPA88672.1 divergent polysaccharide deacetylase family protein [Campylobacterota bacterium]